MCSFFYEISFHTLIRFKVLEGADIVSKNVAAKCVRYILDMKIQGESITSELRLLNKRLIFINSFMPFAVKRAADDLEIKYAATVLYIENAKTKSCIY